MVWLGFPLLLQSTEHRYTPRQTLATTFACLHQEFFPEFHTCMDTCPVHVSISVSLKHSHFFFKSYYWFILLGWWKSNGYIPPLKLFLQLTCSSQLLKSCLPGCSWGGHFWLSFRTSTGLQVRIHKGSSTFPLRLLHQQARMSWRLWGELKILRPVHELILCHSYGSMWS
jgi:hypothetical protein